MTRKNGHLFLADDERCQFCDRRPTRETLAVQCDRAPPHDPVAEDAARKDAARWNHGLLLGGRA